MVMSLTSFADLIAVARYLVCVLRGLVWFRRNRKAADPGVGFRGLEAAEW